MLLKLGEVFLKGANRERLTRTLVDNLIAMLRDVAPARVRLRHGVVVVRANDRSEETVAALADRCADVLGISRLHRARRIAPSMEALDAAAVAMLARRTGTFAVRARRRDRSFPLTSEQLNRHVGSTIGTTLGRTVRLREPDTTLHIEVDAGAVFVYCDGVSDGDSSRGRGGLPVGMSGRALVLLSGGIDSPVAAYRMMRRGMRVDFLHFSGVPLTGPESVFKAYALCSALERFERRPQLYVSSFGKAQQQIRVSSDERNAMIVQRRLMLRVGEVLARRHHYDALVTGDALGQVASQTLTNIASQDAAVSLPVLRPLLAMDKTEIIEQAREIGTFDISQLPGDDCCSLLAPRRAETHAKEDEIARIERRLDAVELAETVADAVRPYRATRERRPSRTESTLNLPAPTAASINAPTPSARTSS